MTKAVTAILRFFAAKNGSRKLLCTISRHGIKNKASLQSGFPKYLPDTWIEK